MKIQFPQKIFAQEIIHYINPGCVSGDTKKEVMGAASIENASRNDLSFCKYLDEKGLKLIQESKAGIIFCDNEMSELVGDIVDKCLLMVSNPRFSFIHCLNHFLQRKVKWGIHKSAIIETDVVLPNKIQIGPMSYLARGVRVGEKTVIGNRVYIGAQAEIGNGVQIQTGAVIGCVGQGFERNEHGAFEKFAQLGSVIIEDDVEIGANSTIVRGALSDTYIGTGTKIGHLVNIGHNVQIGKHVFISAGAVICGSVHIGDYAWIAPNVCIKNGIKIGKWVTAGIGSVVINEVSDGMTVVGIPAKPIKT